MIQSGYKKNYNNKLICYRAFSALFIHVFYRLLSSRNILNKYSFCRADLYIGRLLCNYYSGFHEYVPIDSLGFIVLV